MAALSHGGDLKTLAFEPSKKTKCERNCLEFVAITASTHGGADGGERGMKTLAFEPFENNYSGFCLTRFSREATKPNVLNIHCINKKRAQIEVGSMCSTVCICVKAKVRVTLIH
jgi:hypothetical protein